MKPANASAIPLDMEQARQELEAWRSTHRPRCHIPDSLWKRAAELASQHGLYLTSRTLRVDYMRLKKLVQPTTPERNGQDFGREVVAALVEWGHATLGKGSFIYPVAIQNIASRRIAENLHGEIIGNRANPKYDSVVYRIPFYESPYTQFP